MMKHLVFIDWIYANSGSGHCGLTFGFKKKYASYSG